MVKGPSKGDKPPQELGTHSVFTAFLCRFATECRSVAAPLRPLIACLAHPEQAP